MPSYKDWINKIDIEIDYYSAFIKAWIAFNSWYRSEYPNGSDRAIIEKVKDTANRFSMYTQNLINGDDLISNEFKDNIGRLHEALINAAIVTQERGSVQKQVAFSSIAVTNPKTSVNETYRVNRYKITRNGSQFDIEITRTTTAVVLFNYTQTSYDEEELKRHPDFAVLPPETRLQCQAHYKSVCPYIIESILKTYGNDTNSLDFSGVRFITNVQSICRGLIEILYLLRNALMHGEVFPDNGSHEVYKYAYQILVAIMKKLA